MSQGADKNCFGEALAAEVRDCFGEALAAEVVTS
jgi:hypothetical protein